MRPLLFQPIVSFSVAVGTTATPIKANGNVNELITSFAISVPSTAANNVFFGDSNVTLTTGLELIAGGGPVLFKLEDVRMLYELIDPALKTSQILGCKPFDRVDVPLTVWDLSQVFLVATAATTVAIAVFKEQFI